MLLIPHNINQKKHNKKITKPFNHCYRFFYSKDTLVITLCQKEEKKNQIR